MQTLLPRHSLTFIVSDDDQTVCGCGSRPLPVGCSNALRQQALRHTELANAQVGTPGTPTPQAWHPDSRLCAAHPSGLSLPLSPTKPLSLYSSGAYR